MQKNIKLLITSLFILQSTQAETISKIIDGDTVKVQEIKERLRLYCIDTPESKMVGRQKAQIIDGINVGELATIHLQSMINVGDVISLNCYQNDIHGRPVCELFKNGVNINLLMVKDGYAFILNKYCKDKQYLEALKIAKETRRGIHKYEHLKSPSEFRECVRDVRERIVIFRSEGSLGAKVLGKTPCFFTPPLF